jgi:hypothetical protein
MTNKEVVSELKTQLKIYIGICTQAQFSNMCTRITNDLSKPKTVNEFFNKFGYVGEWNNYQKQS